MDFRTDAACQSNLRNFQQPCLFYFCVCFITAGVFVLLLQDLLQSCSRWGGEPEWRTCAVRGGAAGILFFKKSGPNCFTRPSAAPTTMDTPDSGKETMHLTTQNFQELCGPHAHRRQLVRL